VQLEGLVLGTDGTKADYCQILRSHKPTDTLTMNVLRWPTKEILEGQLNGRLLKVTGTYAGGTASQATATPGSKSTTQTVGDDSGVITMTIPANWQYDGSSWTDVWNIGSKTYNFTAQTLTASTNTKAYADGWTTPGLFIATSRDWGSIGGYVNLLEGVTKFYTECTPNGSKPYKDTTFEGQILLYKNCGVTKSLALVLSARPIKNPQSYLVLIEMKYTTQAELDLLDAILTTADVNP